MRQWFFVYWCTASLETSNKQQLLLKSWRWNGQSIYVWSVPLAQCLKFIIHRFYKTRKPESWKRIIISTTSAFDIVEFRWYFLFPVGFSVYFAVIASKSLQKSSTIQNISVTLSSVIITIFVCNYLCISP